LEAATATTEQRSSALAERIALFTAEGWRVETLMDSQVILVKGRPTNHILHLILSILTFGLWLAAWPAIALDGGEQRVVLSVDEAGQLRLV
jgi:hypothetical protein